MEIYPTDLHPSFADSLSTLPSQRIDLPANETRRPWWRARSASAKDPVLLPESKATSCRPVSASELSRIASIRKNDALVRSYFATVAELAERSAATECADRLYLGGLNDALDAYLRFDARQSRIVQAIAKIGSVAIYDQERGRLEAQLAGSKDEVARQVLQDALGQLERRAITFEALQVDLERVAARKTAIAQRLAAVRELLILDSLNDGEGTSDGGGLALLRALNEDLAQDAIIAQRTEGEHILQSISS